MEHAKDKLYIAPFVLMLALIALAYLLIGIEQGNRNGVIVAAILTLLLLAVAIFEVKRPIKLDENEKRAMDLKPRE